jgi:hypothetical protein
MEYGCEVAVSEGEVYAYTPGRAWRYVGLETVAGRAAHHVACDGRGDLWLDVETSLTLRSQGFVRGPGGFPVAGSTHTIEVTTIEPGPPSPELFEIRRPPGVPALSDEDYQQSECVRHGWCLAEPRPVITPPPAPDPGLVIAADELVRLAHEAPTGLGPYAVTIEDTNSVMNNGGSRTLVRFDGDNRYRIEQTSQIGTVWEATAVTLIGPGYRYTSQVAVDGSTIWTGAPDRGGGTYPLQLAESCEGGWEHRGVDLVDGRVADHVGCAGDDANEYWIDRTTRLAVRLQSLGDAFSGTTVQQVTDIRLGPNPGVEWDLPEGADLR